MSTRDPAAAPPYGAHFTALQVLTSDLGTRSGEDIAVRRYVGATALPATAETRFVGSRVIAESEVPKRSGPGPPPADSRKR